MIGIAHTSGLLGEFVASIKVIILGSRTCMNAMKSILIAIVLTMNVAADAQHGQEELQPFPLPADALQPIEKLAARSDVLILGEIHGTQEVPQVVSSLLQPLTKQGYGTLALEVPFDEQMAISDWATGKTATVPKFFAKPGEDGRGNIQLLSLIRTALSPPYRWKLICFDQSEAAMTLTMLMNATAPDAMVSLGRKRDAAMGAIFAQQRRQLAPDIKVLAICGNFHARTADHSPPDSGIRLWWPSFAAVLRRDNPTWRVNSINVQPQSGEYFNGGRVNAFYASPGRSLEKVEVHLLGDGDWELELSLPKATVATFLAEPGNPF
jgi:hypothetical protein